MIPPTIHYCWYGGGALPDTVRECLRSWQQFLPEYEIKRWDESNLHLDCEFARKAYQLERWAFVSDYMRLQALYREGGIYLDTDMLLLRNIDAFRNHACFMGFESEQLVNGAILGSIAGHPFIRTMIEVYQRTSFRVSSPVTIPLMLTKKLKEIGFRLDNQLQTIREVTVYPQEFFYPLPPRAAGEDYSPYLSENSHAVHLWEFSWMNEFSCFWEGDYREGLKKTLNTLKKSPIQSISYYRDVLYHLRRYFIS